MAEIPDFPHFPDSISNDAIRELTNIVFGVSTDIAPCDLMFVFGGIDPGLWKTALKAYQARLANQILITGGVKTQGLNPRTVGDQPESEIMKDELVGRGVPAKSIHVETRSSNTYENVRHALEVYDFESVNSILAVCTSRGVGRQIRTLGLALPSVKIFPYSFHSEIRQRVGLLTPENWKDDDVGRRYVWGQVLRIFEYGRRGHLIPLSNTSAELKVLLDTAINELS